MAVFVQAVTAQRTAMLRHTRLRFARNALPRASVSLNRSCALPAKLRGLPSSSGRCRRLRLVSPVQMGRRSSKIAMRKGVQDAKKAKLWGKFGKLILQAAKAGGPSPEANVRLGEVLKAAKLAEVPRDVIDRNLKKASDKQQADFSEMTYEAYGAGGTGFVIECLTDNVNRSATEVRTAVTKSGCKMADSGSVLFNFQRQGLLFVPASFGEDEVFEAAMNAGADDIQRAEGEDRALEGYKVLTSADEFAAVRSGLQALGVAAAEDRSGLIFAPLSTIEVDDSAFDANEALMERLLAVDDVDAVHTNCAGLA